VTRPFHGYQELDLVTLMFNLLIKILTSVVSFHDLLLYVPMKIFFMDTSPLSVKGCKMLAYARRSGPLSMEESNLFRSTLVTRGFSFSCLIRRTAPFGCLLRYTRGRGWSILTRILTGLIWCVNILGPSKWYFMWAFLVIKFSMITEILTMWPRPWLIENCNLGYVLWLLCIRALAFHLNFPCNKTVSRVPKGPWR
jgi:hypothetical protein